jgi:hypothetical protein
VTNGTAVRYVPASAIEAAGINLTPSAVVTPGYESGSPKR